MNGPDHYRAAEQLQQHARAVMEATQGPLAGLSPGSALRSGLLTWQLLRYTPPLPWPP